MHTGMTRGGVHGLLLMLSLLLLEIAYGEREGEDKRVSVCE
jgi:hypothetical protein